VTDATGTAVYDLYYPSNYAALGFKSPIVTWGNGTGASPAKVSVFLSHLASYGFTVIASTLPNTGSGNEIDAAAHYLVTQNGVAASVFHGHLNTGEVASVGTSQGAGGAVQAATKDPALIKTVMTFSLPNAIWAGANPDCPTAADCTAHPAALTQPVFFPARTSRPCRAPCAGSWPASSRPPRCGPRWRPGPATARSCTPSWPGSSG
jgi:hypothetical protein